MSQRPGTAERTPGEVFERIQQVWLDDAPGGVGDVDAGLWAEDVVVEVPFAPPGRPRRFEGAETFRAYAAASRAALPVRLEEVRNVVVHETSDPEVIVVEYELTGTVLSTDRRAAAPFIAVLRARNGQVVHWREYQDTLAMAAALEQTTASS